MKKLYVFETFSGIGSQCKALSNIKSKNKEFDFEISYTSEWYTDAIIAYDAIHNTNSKNDFVSMDKVYKYLENFTFSRDSKTPINNIHILKDDYARKLYWAHKRNKNLGDITKITSKLIKNNIDLLTYSFPCQDLSIAGKGKGMDENSNTRSSLLWHIKRILKELERDKKLPKYLLMENVSAIKNKKNIMNLEKFKNNIALLGYKSFEYIENSLDHNIPQGRERYFLLSVLSNGNEVDENIFDISKYRKRINKSKLRHYIDFSNLKESRRHDLFVKSIEKQIDEKKITKENVLKTKFKNLGVYNNFSQANIVIGMESDFVSTITFSGENSSIRVLDFIDGNYKVRQLGGKENLLLMGFSKNDYKKICALGLSDNKIKGFAGNSIVVNVLESIFKMIIDNETNNKKPN